jgi:hypothetical protein
MEAARGRPRVSQKAGKLAMRAWTTRQSDEWLVEERERAEKWELNGRKRRFHSCGVRHGRVNDDVSHYLRPASQFSFDRRQVSDREGARDAEFTSLKG